MEYLHERPVIRAALKTRTQPYHDRLEAVLSLLERPFTQADYRILLERFYGFYAPIETALAQVLTNASPLDFTRRRKTLLLERDLVTLGSSTKDVLALPQCPFLPVISHIAQALDCLYVLEGATLGGQVISRRLHELFGFTADSGCAFFQSYGKDVGPMWQTFCTALTNHDTTDVRRENMIAAACETFAAFERWVGG
jgi:heme oxygenase (biliverdin-IX-beta and delta-forming)